MVQLGRGRRITIGPVGHLTPTEARERAEKVLGNLAHAGKIGRSVGKLTPAFVVGASNLCERIGPRNAAQDFSARLERALERPSVYRCKSKLLTVSQHPFE
jgi:hypothetical protein